MAESPTGIIPEQLMAPRFTSEVMQFLQRLHVDSETKAELFRGWAMEVGVKINAAQVNAVRRSGTDALGPTP
jgi:hypothetical protein